VGKGDGKVGGKGSRGRRKERGGRYKKGK